MKWMFILSILDNQGEPKINWAWGKTVNSGKYTCRCWKSYSRMAAGSFCMTILLPILPWQWSISTWIVAWWRLITHQRKLTCSIHLSLIPYSENHLQRKIPGHWGPQKQHNCQNKCCSFGRLWGLFCATFKKVYEMCCSQRRLLRRKIKGCLSYCICICSHWPSPGTLLLDVVCVNHKELTLPNQQIPLQSERTTACELCWYGLDYHYLLRWMGPRMGFINLVNRDTFLQ